MTRTRSIACAALLAAMMLKCAIAADWPMWRCDANRSGRSDTALPTALYPQWAHRLPAFEKAFSDASNSRMTFDDCYLPVAMGSNLLICSPVSDSVTAYDTETGATNWTFYADAPMRFPPACSTKRGLVYCVSDDGYLYCLKGSDGSLVWKFRGAPNNRQILGNERLCSTWPARGGPVVVDDKVYFAAGIWPFMGVFIYELDANTGAVNWMNDQEGSRWMNQPHGGSTSFSGLAPQGCLVAVGDSLIVPNGRAVAACLDRLSGDYRYFHHSSGKSSGGTHASGFGTHFNNSGEWFRLSDGKSDGELSDGAILVSDSSASNHVGYLCMAGSTLYKGERGSVTAYEDVGTTIVQRWQTPITGEPATMLAADDKLFVVTKEGYLYCFGETDNGAGLPDESVVTPWPSDAWTRKAQEILAAGPTNGTCIVAGAGTGRLMEELAVQSRLSVIGFSTSPTTVKRLRARWQAHGFPAERLSIRLGTAAESGLPPYLARLITTEDPAEGGWGGGEKFVATLFQVLRPYGGTMLLEGDHRALFGRSCRSRGLTNSAITRSGGFTRLTRPGAIPGSADWDHQYADAAHSVMAPDQLVKAPLGLLWFGGTVNDNVLPRHGHGPSQLVSHGRLYILGANHVAARDVYTGALLWEKAMSGVGAAFDNTGHESGANHMGSTMVASSNGLYLCHNSGDFMLLDGDTGESVTSFAPTDGSYVAQAVLWEELLVTASDPYEFKAGDRAGKNNWNETCSRELIIMNRFTGQELWSRSASNAWYHNTIIVGSNSLFAIDRLAPGQVDALSRRGLGPVDVGAVFELYALDVKSGEKRWSTTNEVFGTWLGYSEEYDVLIQSTRTSRDMQDSRTKRIIAYSGSDGTVLWDKSQGVAEGAYILHHDKIIMQTHSGSTALELLTGKPYMIKHPLTGAETALSWKRYYGCNTAVASEHLMTFRSGAAGYYDLRTHSGTGNFGGAKSGCTSSYLPANGILNAVDYTRTCSCSYQNQTSMGLIHMPNMEQWTFSTLPAGGTIRQVGINFGAPGDRVSDAGTLWTDYPSVGSSSPNASVSVEGSPTYFYNHAMHHPDEATAWITGSGVKGASAVAVTLNNSTNFDVRLYFAEPDRMKAGERVFSVSLEGNRVIADLDIASLVGSDGSGYSAAFSGIAVSDGILNVGLRASAGETILCGIEAVSVVESDGELLPEKGKRD